MNKLFLILIVPMVFTSVAAQSSKDLKKANVKSLIITEYDYTSGKEKSRVTEEFTFNEEGEETEEIEYDENGKIDKHTKSEYDENGKKISKTFFFPNGKIQKVNKYFYEGNLRIAKMVYDGEGKLQYKEEYKFEKFSKE